MPNQGNWEIHLLGTVDGLVDGERVKVMLPSGTDTYVASGVATRKSGDWFLVGKEDFEFKEGVNGW